MDFIERIFGVTPDGGSGALEVAIVLVPIATIAVVAFLLNRRSRRTQD
jgi:hypothetical protein